MSQSRQLAAIMFTDIVGYTALMGNDEQKAFVILNKNRALHKPVIEEYHGRWIKELGDGVMASFYTVSDAVNAAMKIQEGCMAANDFQLRIGIHQGEVIFEAEDVFGDVVNIAARIQAAAKPGCIYVSESVQNNLSNKQGIQSKFIKVETLKNVREPVKVYEVLMKHDSIIQHDAIAPAENKLKAAVQNSIAVLPFANMSSDPEQEFFSDGISEEIINMLAQVPGLKVAGRTSAFSFKGKNQDLRLIGEQLNVNHILEGSVRKSGNKLRITAQLIKVADGYHLYSEKFDRELEDIFEIQDEISLAILNAIKVKLGDADKEDVLKRYTNNTEAYQLYLQGRYHVNKYNGTEAFTNGIKYYEEAIKLEPGYALAYAGIAYCYFELLMDALLPPEQCLPPLYEAVKRTMELDDAIADSHLALADLKCFVEWDMKNAKTHFKKVLELNPNSAAGNAHYGMYQMFRGNLAEAKRYALISQSLDPFSLQNSWEVAWTLLYLGLAGKALELAKSMIKMEPNFFGGHLIAGNILLFEDNFAEAKPLLEQAYKLYPSYAGTLEPLGTLYWKMGEKEKCNEIIKKMEAVGKSQSASNFHFGLLYLSMEEYETAAGYFNKGVEKRDGLMLFLKETIHAMDDKVNNPLIQQVLEKIERFKKA
jgi:TolB-like protein